MIAINAILLRLFIYYSFDLSHITLLFRAAIFSVLSLHNVLEGKLYHHKLILAIAILPDKHTSTSVPEGEEILIDYGHIKFPPEIKKWFVDKGLEDAHTLAERLAI